STSSIAQPVTAIEPVMPLAPSDGVSISPEGARPVPCGNVVRATVTGPAVFDAPLNDSDTEPFVVPEIGRPEANCTPIVSVAGPVPDAGETVIQGLLGVAVHVNV